MKGYVGVVSSYVAWFRKGKSHRTDGPAIVWLGGTKWWYLNGKHHRTAGPAVIQADGTQEWWLDGRHLTEEEFNERRKEWKGMSGLVPTVFSGI